MPNWCENTLTVVGPKDLVLKLAEQVKSNEAEHNTSLSLNKIIPMPEELVGTTAGSPKDANAAELKEKYGYENWYEWANDNWDTKWDVTAMEPQEVEVDRDGDYALQYHFDTAWSPAFKVFEALSEQHPRLYLHLRFEEAGMGFAGYRAYAGGELVNEFDLNGVPSIIDYDAYYAAEELGEDGTAGEA